MIFSGAVRTDRPRRSKAAALAGLGCRISATFTLRASAGSMPSLSRTVRKRRYGLATFLDAFDAFDAFDARTC